MSTNLLAVIVSELGIPCELYSILADVNPSSTHDSLLASTCSSCEVQEDKSAYWTPQLYYAHNNGTIEEVQNEGMTVYYVGSQHSILLAGCKLTSNQVEEETLLTQ
jgi:hypothetical protein